MLPHELWMVHLITMVSALCSVCSWWVGGAPGQDHGAQRAGSRLLRHGVWGNRQGHHQRRPGHTCSRQNSQWICQPAREDWVPQRSLRHEGFQLSPCGRTQQNAFQTVSSYSSYYWLTGTLEQLSIHLWISVYYSFPSFCWNQHEHVWLIEWWLACCVDAAILTHSLTPNVHTW